MPKNFFPALVIIDGGGTVWYSMDVLWDHYSAAFSYFGLLSRSQFEVALPFRQVTELSSLCAFNSRRSIGRALLAMHFCNVQPEEVLSGQVAGHEGKDPEACLHDLIAAAYKRCARTCFDALAREVGQFLSRALYNYDDSGYPSCPLMREGLAQLRQDGYRLAVLSNRQHGSTMTILRNLGVAQFFDVVEAPPDEREPLRKPVDVVLKRCGISDKPWRAVFLGDSNLDIASAHEFKLFSIAVLSGMGSMRVLRLASPSATVNNILEAAHLLRRIRVDWYRLWEEHIRRLGSMGASSSDVSSRHDPNLVGPTEAAKTKALPKEQVYLIRDIDNAQSLGELVNHQRADSEGLAQACVFVALEDPRGWLFVQHRGGQKSVTPNLKTISASGHVQPGESWKEAAVRELEEELHVRCREHDLQVIGAVRGVTHCGPVFLARSAEAPRPDSAEVDAEHSMFMSASELSLLAKCSVMFTPSGLLAIGIWLARRGVANE